MVTTDESLKDGDAQKASETPKRWAWNTLQFRISVLLSMSLLPLGLIAVLQTQRGVEAANAVYRSTLSAQTAQLAKPEKEAVLHAIGLAKGLGVAVSQIGESSRDCQSLMERIGNDSSAYTFVGFVDLDGQSVCNNQMRALDLSDSALGRGSDFAISFAPSDGPNTRAAIAISQPVFVNDEVIGHIALSLPTAMLDGSSETGDDALMLTFNAEGDILTSDMPRTELEPFLPAKTLLRDMAGNGIVVFSEESQSGEIRDFAVVPIIDNQAYALGSFAQTTFLSPRNPLSATTLVFPLLMWLVTVIIAVWALRRQVIEPVRKLRMRMRAFGDGRTVVRENTIKNAPSELRDIGAVFETMADKIVRDEAELEDKVFEHEMLLREVHHRVKNNLQLMSSIISMQIRETDQPVAEEALKNARSRLTSLAKFHQDLYQTGSLGKLSANSLLHDLSHQLVSLGAGQDKQIDLQLELEEVTLSPDQASALAMLVTEALTNAVKYCASDADGPCLVRIALREEDRERDMIMLEIENSVAAGSLSAKEGLGGRLINAFGSQLEAEIERSRKEDTFLLTALFERKANEKTEFGTAVSNPAL